MPQVMGAPINDALSGVETVLRVSPDGQPRHNFYDANLFEVDAVFHGDRLLLFDDVYTTGSRAQSAAAALRRAGAGQVTVLTLARRINPQYCDVADLVWRRQRELGYDLEQQPYFLN